MLLQSNADGIRDQKLTQTKDFVLTALKLKMQNISWQTVQLMLMSGKRFSQKLAPSPRLLYHSMIMKNVYISSLVKTDRY